MKKIGTIKEETSTIKIVFASNESFFEDVAEKFFKKWTDEAEVTKVFGNELSPSKLQEFFQTRGIFESVSLIHLKNAEKIGKETTKKMLEFIKKPLEKVYLFVEYKGDLSARNKKLDPLWREITYIVKAENMNPQSAQSYIQKKVKQKAINISDNALLMLESWAGRDIHLLPAAMDILCIAAENTKNITEQDVLDLLGTGGSVTIFELQDRFLARDTSGISEALRKVENDASASPIAFVSALAKQMSNIAKLHSLIKNGHSESSVTPEMVEKGMQFWQFEKLKNHFQLWNDSQTLEVLKKLAIIDKAIKGDPVDSWIFIEFQLQRFLRE